MLAYVHVLIAVLFLVTHVGLRARGKKTTTAAKSERTNPGTFTTVGVLS